MSFIIYTFSDRAESFQNSIKWGFINVLPDMKQEIIFFLPI